MSPVSPVFNTVVTVKVGSSTVKSQVYSIFVTNVIPNILNDIKPIVLYLAIRLSSLDKNASSHYLYAPGFKG